MHFTKDHEWVDIQGSQASVGITDYAQNQLGEIVYIELPEVGSTTQAGESFGEVESVKSSAEIKSPISGTVSSVNEQIKETPSLINSGAEKPDKGWLIRLEDFSEVSILSTIFIYLFFFSFSNFSY